MTPPSPVSPASPSRCPSRGPRPPGSRAATRSASASTGTPRTSRTASPRSCRGSFRSSRSRRASTRTSRSATTSTRPAAPRPTPPGSSGASPHSRTPAPSRRSSGKRRASSSSGRRAPPIRAASRDSPLPPPSAPTRRSSPAATSPSPPSWPRPLRPSSASPAATARPSSTRPARRWPSATASSRPSRRATLRPSSAPTSAGATSIFVTGLVREARLPLRAGFGTLFARNGVLVGYGDLHAALSRADVSFNVFYAFRDGESAWLYARLLAVCRAVTGAAQLSVDPYQIGLGNEEAIASGAFWFYRKLGFRSADAALERLASREESHLAASPGRRTSPAFLRRLTTAPLLYDVPGERPALPDAFHLRDVGLDAARRMAASGLSPDAWRARAASRVRRALRLAPRSAGECEALNGLALLLDLVDLTSWSPAERRALAALVRAKSGRDERRYARFTSANHRLAEALVAVSL